MDKLKEIWITKKKTIVILGVLVVALCLLLSMCGKKESEHGALLEMLEKGEYQSAHYYIDDLQRKEIEAGKADEHKESQISLLYGEWTLVSNYGNEDEYESISFDEDGSCKIGEDAMKWRVTDEQDTYININVTKGETKKYRVGVSTQNKEISLSLSEYVDEEGATRSCGEYKKLSFYDEIKITTENWDDYFEIKEEGKFGENAFGEVESFNYYQYISLKEEYIEKFSSSLSDLVMELDFTYGKKGCQVDMTNRKYTLTDSYEVDTYDHDSSIYQFGYYNHEDETHFRAEIMSSYYDKTGSYLSGFKTDMQVLRVQGTIYLLK